MFYLIVINLNSYLRLEATILDNIVLENQTMVTVQFCTMKKEKEEITASLLLNPVLGTGVGDIGQEQKQKQQFWI